MAVISFLSGGLAYMGLELVWRGRTHWSMGLAGGLCTALLTGIFYNQAIPLWAAYPIGCAVITAVEFIFGYIFNIRLGKTVWDYSKRPLNLYGQVCPQYSLMWGLMGVALWGAVRLLTA